MEAANAIKALCRQGQIADVVCDSASGGCVQTGKDDEGASSLGAPFAPHRVMLENGRNEPDYLIVRNRGCGQ
jgi:hypothetical protein